MGLYSSMIFAIFPGSNEEDPNSTSLKASWEIALIGFSGGVIAAGFVAVRMRGELVASRRRARALKGWRAKISSGGAAISSCQVTIDANPEPSGRRSKKAGSGSVQLSGSTVSSTSAPGASVASSSNKKTQNGAADNPFRAQCAAADNPFFAG